MIEDLDLTMLQEIRLKRPELAARADAGNALAAIRLHCLECVCGSGEEVKRCTAPECALFAFRLGKSPRKRQMTDEQRAAAADRLRKMRGASAEVDEVGEDDEEVADAQ